MPPSVSVRDYIRWGHAPVSEPTDTLVLTSPNRRFVDVRILRTHLPEPNPENGLYAHVHAFPEWQVTVLPSSSIDWAFAGRSTSRDLEAPKGAPDTEPTRTHDTFKHWVDSRTRAPESVVDEGEMVTMERGRHLPPLTLEWGSMINPATGVEQSYEELWCGRKLMHDGHGSEVACAVLEVEDDERGLRGMIVRVAQFCQGVLRAGDDVAVERWEYGPMGWLRVVKVGKLFLPCDTLLDGRPVQRTSADQQLQYTDLDWAVKESVGGWKYPDKVS